MKQAIQTDKAPAAIGPYSQAVRVDCRSLVFCSGQIPLDPKTGEIVGETAADQCRQALDNLRAVIEAAGGDLSKVVRTTVYLADMNDFAAVNDVYAGYFGGTAPARAAMQVARLPRDVRIEIDAIVAL
jgi:2-iminobutanoate/2-iminopropanoate deaminase